MNADQLMLIDKILELIMQGTKFGDNVVILCEQWWKLSEEDYSSKIEVLLLNVSIEQ